jgi:hypothetical protein
MCECRRRTLGASLRAEAGCFFNGDDPLELMGACRSSAFRNRSATTDGSRWWISTPFLQFAATGRRRCGSAFDNLPPCGSCVPSRSFECSADEAEFIAVKTTIPGPVHHYRATRVLRAAKKKKSVGRWLSRARGCKRPAPRRPRAIGERIERAGSAAISSVSSARRMSVRRGAARRCSIRKTSGDTEPTAALVASRSIRG